jgi:hypothetical protein
VRIAAGDRDARLRQAQLGPDDVHDPLPRIVEAELEDPVRAVVRLEELDHLAPLGIGDARDAALTSDRRHVMVRGREGLARAAHLAAFLRELREGVECAFVHVVHVHVDERLAFAARDDVALPDLIEQCAGGWHG